MACGLLSLHQLHLAIKDFHMHTEKFTSA